MTAQSNLALLVMITAVSAFLDARGFVWATAAWEGNFIVPSAVAGALMYFFGSIAPYQFDSSTVSAVNLRQFRTSRGVG